MLNFTALAWSCLERCRVSKNVKEPRTCADETSPQHAHLCQPLHRRQDHFAYLVLRAGSRMLIHTLQVPGRIGRGLALQAVEEKAASMTTLTHIAGTGIAVLENGQSMAEFTNPAMSLSSLTFWQAFGPVFLWRNLRVEWRSLRVHFGRVPPRLASSERYQHADNSFQNSPCDRRIIWHGQSHRP